MYPGYDIGLFIVCHCECISIPLCVGYMVDKGFLVDEPREVQTLRNVACFGLGIYNDAGDIG